DVELVAQLVCQGVEQIPRRCASIRGNVSGKRILAGAYGPNVQIVNFLDSRDTLHAPDHRLNIYVRRSAFQQHVDRVANQFPGTVHDQKADRDADHGIGDQPSETPDQHAGDDCADRAERVANYVQERSAHVEVLVGCRAQQRHVDAVDGQSPGRYQQHLETPDDLRAPNAAHGFITDED